MNLSALDRVYTYWSCKWTVNCAMELLYCSMHLMRICKRGEKQRDAIFWLKLFSEGRIKVFSYELVYELLIINIAQSFIIDWLLMLINIKKMNTERRADILLVGIMMFFFLLCSSFGILILPTQHWYHCMYHILQDEFYFWARIQ
jgi:hypothetical protein